LPLAHLISGVVLGLSAGIAPGPLLTLVISQSLSYGIAEGIKVAVAPLITDLPIIIVALVLGSQLAKAPLPLGLLSLAGAGYICYLAWESFGVRPAAQRTRVHSPDSVKKGVLTNALNPHPYFFWITVGTPFLHKSWAVAPRLAILWLMGFYTMLVGTKILLSVLVGHWRNLLQGRVYLWINRCLGLILLCFAVVLARDGLQLMGIWTD
jgi:threonine/homoserine/homoserine lactone efflux protein